MADEKEKPTAPDPLSEGERAYFDSRGEKDIPSPPAPADPPPAAEPPAAEPPAAATPPQPPMPENVPVATLLEERKRRQDAEERARNIELLNARMEERFRAFRDSLAPRQAQPPQGEPPPAV